MESSKYNVFALFQAHFLFHDGNKSEVYVEIPLNVSSNPCKHGTGMTSYSTLLNRHYPFSLPVFFLDIGILHLCSLQNFPTGKLFAPLSDVHAPKAIFILAQRQSSYWHLVGTLRLSGFSMLKLKFFILTTPSMRRKYVSCRRFPIVNSISIVTSSSSESSIMR